VEALGGRRTQMINQSINQCNAWSVQENQRSGSYADGCRFRFRFRFRFCSVLIWKITVGISRKTQGGACWLAGVCGMSLWRVTLLQITVRGQRKFYLSTRFLVHDVVKRVDWSMNYVYRSSI
jgi:hypothetical protein